MPMDAPKRSANNEYARLSPWAILHFAASAIAQIISNAFALLAGGFGLYQAGNVAYVIAGAVGVFILVLLSAALRYFYFSYLIQGNSVQIKQGVFSKKHLNLQFDRIQNVNIEHPFYFRPLNLVTLKIESAGSVAEEVSLAALLITDAEHIRAEIQANPHAKDLSGSAETESGSADDLAHNKLAVPMLTRGFGDLVIHGLTNNRAWIILGVVGTLFGQAADEVGVYFTAIGADVGGFVNSNGFLGLLLVIGVIVFLAVVFVAAISVIGSIFTYYGYELYRTDDAFRVQRGLLTRHDINMKKSRIQAVRVRRDWLDMLLERMNVVLEQISHGIPGQANGIPPDKHILVPSVEAHHTDELTREALAAEKLSNLCFTGISRRYFHKFAGITTLFYVGIGLTFSLLVPEKTAWLSLLILPFIAHIALLYMRWRRWGIAIDNGIVVVRKGIIGVDHTLIPAFKIQEIGRMGTPLMRRHRLTSISLTIASGTLWVPFLPDQIVRSTIDYCLFETESSNRSWM